MLDRVKKSFNEGIKSIKWVAAFVSERTKVEASMARLFYENSKLENKLDELYRDIGRRVLELKDKEDKEVLKDIIILQEINEVKRLKEEIEDYKSRAHELNKPKE